MHTLWVALLWGSVALLTADPVVHAPWGTVKGTANVTEDWSMYHAFLGIPFAVPPVGDRRFSRPEAHPGFNYTFNATKYGQPCIQNLGRSGMVGIIGDEDCLTLNIFTPASHSEISDLPVMVWIYGGAFVVGSAQTYDASPIAARGNVIVVTIQYRLGAFGFLSTGDTVAKGNYGLWDQHLAIQWVKTNIRSFGGDDNRITLFGESAGSMSVAYQALYPGSKGLFQGTIMQSGSVTTTGACKRDPAKDVMVVANKLNCLPSGKSDHAAVFQCLKHVSAKALAQATWPMSTDPMTALYDSGFAPTVDGEFIKDEPLVLMNDQSFLKTVGLHNLNCMVSVNSNEGGRLMSSALNIDNLLNSTLSLSLLDKSYYRHHLIPTILELYFGTSTPAMVNAVASENIPASLHGNTLDPQVIANTTADAQMVVPTIVFARAHAKLTNSTQTGKKTYMYLFDQKPSFINRTGKGMLHGEDILFTFGMTNLLKTTPFMAGSGEPTEAEKDLSNTLIDFLTGFARDGNPSPAVSFKLHGDWPEFTLPEEKYLHLNTSMSIASHPFSSRMTLWTETLPQLLRVWNEHHHSSTEMPKPGLIG